jgi:hypothetical protein
MMDGVSEKRKAEKEISYKCRGVELTPLIDDWARFVEEGVEFGYVGPS